MPNELEITSPPKKRRYCDGEEIDLDGLAFAYGGRDVTGDVELEWTPDVTGWPRGRKRMYVRADYDGKSAVVELRRRQPPAFFAMLALLLVAAAFGIALWRASYAPEDLQGGSRVEAQGDRGDLEAHAALDARAEESQMAVNIASSLKLGDGGRVRVAFLVEDGDSSFPQRLELLQDGRSVYRSATVLPGYAIEWAEAEGAHLGDVVAMVHRVDEKTGADVGSPVAIELEIVPGSG